MESWPKVIYNLLILFRWVHLTKKTTPTVGSLVKRLKDEFGECEAGYELLLYLEKPFCLPPSESAGMNRIKIGLPGKSIIGDYFQENMTSPRPFLLLRIRVAIQ